MSATHLSRHLTRVNLYNVPPKVTGANPLQCVQFGRATSLLASRNLQSLVIEPEQQEASFGLVASCCDTNSSQVPRPSALHPQPPKRRAVSSMPMHPVNKPTLNDKTAHLTSGCAPPDSTGRRPRLCCKLRVSHRCQMNGPSTVRAQ